MPNVIQAEEIGKPLDLEQAEQTTAIPPIYGDSSVNSNEQEHQINIQGDVDQTKGMDKEQNIPVQIRDESQKELLGEMDGTEQVQSGLESSDEPTTIDEGKNDKDGSLLEVADNQGKQSADKTKLSADLIESGDSLQNKEEPISTKVIEPKPLLSINLLGLKLSLLGANMNENGQFQPSLLGLSLNDSSNWGVLNLGLSLPLIGDASIDLISGGSQKSASGEVISSNNQLLGIGLNNSMILGDLNVGVLPSNVESSETQNSVSGGLAAINLNNKIGNAHLGVIEGSKQWSQDSSNFHGGLLITDLQDSIVGDAHLGLAEVNAIQTSDSKELHASLVNGEIVNPILGDSHLGVIDFNQKETSEGKTTSGGIIIIDLEDSPIGDVHIGAGEFEKNENGKPNSNTTNPEDEGNIPQNEGTNSDQDPIHDGSKDNEQPGEETQIPGNGDQPNENSEEEISNPSSPVNPSIPDQEDLQQDNENNLDALEHINVLDDEMNDLNELDRKGSVSQWMNELIDAGNHTVLNKDIEQSLSKLLEGQNDVNDLMSDIPTTSQIVPNGSGNGASGSTNNVGGGGNGLVAHLDREYMNEDYIHNQLHFILKNVLPDQWIKAPPGKPPKDLFFL